jgi:hypothetical protein
MKPFYHLTPPTFWVGKPFYALFPLWRWWLKRQAWSKCDVVHAIMGFATEPFEWADKHGALKVVDAPNSHPTSYIMVTCNGSATSGVPVKRCRSRTGCLPG